MSHVRFKEFSVRNNFLTNQLWNSDSPQRSLGCT